MAYPTHALTHIKIGPVLYAVSELEEIWVDGESLWGQISYAEAKIEIKKSLSNIPKQATLLHEAIHGVLESTGHREAARNEDIIGALAHGLLQVLRENPEFTQGLLAEGENGP